MTTAANSNAKSPAEPEPKIIVRLTHLKGRAAKSNVFWACRQLGVSRMHLYYVMRGERRSPRIEEFLRRHGDPLGQLKTMNQRQAAKSHGGLRGFAALRGTSSRAVAQG